MVKPPNTPKLSDRQVQAKLAQLKKVGLYRGNNRKAPTEYGRRVLRKYMDVVEGKAHVVTIPRSEAKEFREAHRVTRNKIVLPKERAKEVVRYSKKDKALYTYRTNAQGEQYRRQTLKFRASNVESLPALKGNQVYAVPFNRWGTVEYVTVTNKAELQGLINQYQSKYSNMMKYVQILEYRGRKAKAVSMEDLEDENE